MSEDILYKIKSVMIGHAIEFKSRKEFDETPVLNMMGFGTYPYPAGCWSDDTSMSLAALDSLSKGTIDWNEIMLHFRKWLVDGEYTPTGDCFDAGGTCVEAILNYFTIESSVEKCGQTGEHSNGNGSMMRMHPFVLFTEYSNYSGDHFDIIHKASALTHAHERSKIACGIYSIILRQLLHFPNKDSINIALEKAKCEYRDNNEIQHFKRIFDKRFGNTDRNEIKSSGYVVETLEAAIWCLLTTNTYRDCVLAAVNLGDDTDTVAAVAGGLAGALYGYDEIPIEWRNSLCGKILSKICVRWLIVAGIVIRKN